MWFQIILAVALAVLVIGWLYTHFTTGREKVIEYNFDDTQTVTQVLIGVKGGQITGLFIRHPDGEWDEVKTRPKH